MTNNTETNARPRPLVSIPAVRRWARTNGLPVGRRGRLARSLVREYVQHLGLPTEQYSK